MAQLKNVVFILFQFHAPTFQPLNLYFVQDPFVAGVTESDRVVVKILMGEVNAEVEETVENIKPDDLVSTVIRFSLSRHLFFPKQFLYVCSSASLMFPHTYQEHKLFTLLILLHHVPRDAHANQATSSSHSRNIFQVLYSGMPSSHFLFHLQMRLKSMPS